MSVDKKIIQEFIFNVDRQNAHDDVVAATDMILCMDPDIVPLFITEPMLYLECLLGYFEYHEAYELCTSIKQLQEYYQNKPLHHEKSSSNTIN
jgi:hypothetical protein